MTSDELRALQRPIKERYEDDPDAARITLEADGALDDEIACSVQTGRALVKAPPPGLIAFACAQVGLTPVAMRRIRLGRLPMAGLKVGQWRYVQEYERF